MKLINRRVSLIEGSPTVIDSGSGQRRGSKFHLTRHHQKFFRFGSILVAVVIFGSTTSPASAANINSDRTKISKLEKQVTSQGSLVQSLVTRSDTIAFELAGIHAKIARNRALLETEHRQMANAEAGLRSLAIADYVGQATGNAPSLETFTNSADAASMMAKQEYLGVANGRISQAIANLQNLQHQVAATTSVLQVQAVAVATTLTQATSVNQVAENALNQENAALGKLTSSELAMVIAADARAQAAKAKAAESLLASQQQSVAAQSSTPTPVTVSVPLTPGSYADPLRAVSGLAPERIDQGVDFRGFGPLYAIGDGVVISTYNGGWPGGTFISYRLVDGPANGLVVYAAEDIYPRVQVGQSVTSQTVIGDIYEGPDGIETGWAQSSGDGLTMAGATGQYGGGNSTAFGYNFSRLLVTLGGRGGILQGSSASGFLPSGWPQF